MTGIDLSIAADMRSATSAINRGLIDPLEDVSELLELIGKDGDDATRDIERGMRDAQRRTEDAKDEVRAIRDELNRTGRSGKSAGQDIGDGMKDAKRGVEDFGDEANSTARETAASFDGSAESIGDAFQEIAANAFAGFGPAGAAAGLAAALGIGLAVSGFTAVEEERKRLEERASDLAQAYIDAGSQVLDALTIASKTSEILTSTDPATKRDLADLTTALGDQSLAARVLAGDTKALAQAQSLAGAAQAELDKLSPQQIANTGKRKTEIGEEAKAYQFLIEKVKEQTTVSAEAQAMLQAQSDVLLALAADAGTATEQVDQFGNRLLTLPKGEQIVISAETGLATANVDSFKGDVEALPKTVTTTAVFDDAQARRDYAAFRADVTKKLGIPTTLVAPSGIRAPQVG